MIVPQAYARVLISGKPFHPSLTFVSAAWAKLYTAQLCKGKTNRRGRLSTVDLLIKVACFLTKVNNILNMKKSCIRKTSFSSQLKNEQNKLECYITLGWKDLPLTNTLAYLPFHKLRRE
jgi:hypothetical protein